MNRHRAIPPIGPLQVIRSRERLPSGPSVGRPHDAVLAAGVGQSSGQRDHIEDALNAPGQRNRVDELPGNAEIGRSGEPAIGSGEHLVGGAGPDRNAEGRRLTSPPFAARERRCHRGMRPGLASVAGDLHPGQALDAAIVEGGRIDDLTAGIDGDVPGPRRQVPIQMPPGKSSVLALEQPSELARRVDVVGLRL